MRDGGVSIGPFSSLNLGLSTGDDDENIRENRRRLGEQAGIPVDRFAIAGQVHEAEILAVRAPGLYPGYDGLVTDEENLLLVITAADCAAILLADDQAGVVGACHSGWRGTVANISANTVAAMQDLGAAPARIRAYASPCISLENFEVGPEVAEQFDDRYVFDRPPERLVAAASGTSSDAVSDEEVWRKPHVDLKAAIRDQLQAAGLSEDAIEVSPHCTMGETDLFYSYRAEGGTTGRMMGFIGRLAQ